MSKFRIFFILLLTLNISNQFTLDDEQVSIIYDKLLLLIQGMTDKGEGQCLNCFKENKDKLSHFIVDLIPAVFGGYDNITDIIAEDIAKYKINYFLLIQIAALCRIDKFGQYALGFNENTTRVEIFETIGTNIKNNSKQFLEGSSKFVIRRGIDEKIKLIGKIASAALNITLS